MDTRFVRAGADDGRARVHKAISPYTAGGGEARHSARTSLCDGLVDAALVRVTGARLARVGGITHHIYTTYADPLLTLILVCAGIAVIARGSIPETIAGSVLRSGLSVRATHVRLRLRQVRCDVRSGR